MPVTLTQCGEERVADRGRIVEQALDLVAGRALECGDAPDIGESFEQGRYPVLTGAAVSLVDRQHEHVVMVPHFCDMRWIRRIYENVLFSPHMSTVAATASISTS
ncbi:hypothetical protein ACFSSF_04550 [Dietzia aerolata]|uniref:hypothetical protein n=1 Tax=Dietzia aerolata TaxID=595984 RepID=UPI003638B68B